MASVSFKGATRLYPGGNRPAVDQMTLDIADGEFLTLLGAFRANTWVAAIATTGVILSAAYALWLFARVMFGPLDKPSLKSITDLSPREIGLLLPLVVLTVWYGIHPAPVLDAFAASTDALLKSTQAAIGAAKTAALMAH